MTLSIQKKLMKLLLIIALITLLFSKITQAETAVSNPFFYINLSSNTNYYEFKFYLAQNQLNKTHSKKIKYIKENGRTTKVISRSPEFWEDLAPKYAKSKSIAKKHKKNSNYNKFHLRNDGKYLAHIDVNDNLSIKNTSDNKPILENNFSGKMEDFDWLGNTDCFAIIRREHRKGYSPFELLGRLAGHHTPYNSFYLDIFTLSGERVHTEKLHKELRYGKVEFVFISSDKKKTTLSCP